MNDSVPVLLALLCLAAVSTPTSALECYACRLEKNITGFSVSPDISKMLKPFPKCHTMEEEDPSEKFKMTCSAKLKNSVCANVVDPDDPTNRVRTCIGKPNGSPELPYCLKTACYCGEDLCNSSRVPLGSVALIASVLATLRLVGW